MIGVGIDLGSAFVKGVAVQLFEDGSVTLLAAVTISAADLRTRPDLLAAPLARHRPTPFSRAVAVRGLSHPDAVVDRVRLPLPDETGPVSYAELLLQILQGKLPAPAGAAVLEDTWDFLPLEYRRRAADLQTLGKKHADLLVARLPAASVTAAPFRWKPLHDGGIVPAGLALLDEHLRFHPTGRTAPTLVLDLGASSATALLIGETGLLRGASAPLPDLIGSVERLAQLTAGQGHERLVHTDLASSDPASQAVRDLITRAAQRIKGAIWGQEVASPLRPGRVLLTGGLATVRGAARTVSTALDVPTDVLGHPDVLRLAAPLPDPYPRYAAAVGCALRAAGAASVPVHPRRQQLVAVKGRPGFHWPAIPAISLPSLPDLPGLHLPGVSLPSMPHLPNLPQLAQLHRLAQAAHLPNFSQIQQINLQTAVSFGERTWSRLKSAARWVYGAPERWGWGWVAVGALAILCMPPTAWWLTQRGNVLAEAREEYEDIRPDAEELARQAGVIRDYAALTGSGAIVILPVGEVVQDIAIRSPAGTYLARISADRNELVLLGRATGESGKVMDRLREKLKGSAALRRAGYVPAGQP